ncbi:hypothetical protein [Haloechinothrix sp. LS1_15]|uniref:hypothetical protein n=1 Tax=Haloechinothrix sp. LS1_15 TaxID=2652248 RepID=UPI002948244C|nr:hypothetical protein [Haloechinothrix sp. LS1_15]MDV6011977.1 hypothetical protein [Haloechinothrix sp. LS1_15]
MSRRALVLVSGVVSFALSLGIVALLAPTVTLSTDDLHAESSADSRVTYDCSGAELSSELWLVRVSRLLGTHHELRIGPGAPDRYYPAPVAFGDDEPRIDHVEWGTGEVAVTFESGDSVRVAAENYCGVQ